MIKMAGCGVARRNLAAPCRLKKKIFRGILESE